jgi:HemY protein
VNAASDPAWTADGYVSDHWLPASPVTGRIDAFEWRVPLTGTLTGPAIEPAIEPQMSAVKSVEAAAAAVEETVALEPEKPVPPPAELVTVTPRTEPVTVAPAASEPIAIQTEARPEPKLGDGKPEPVIPLVHAPDDPGPDGADESAPTQSDGGWRKILG